MQHKNLSPRHNAEPAISLEGVVSLLTLATVVVLGVLGIPLVGQTVIVPLVGLFTIGLALNLALVWLERRYNHLRLWDWIGSPANLALLTAGLHLSWGLSSPYLPLYAVYIVIGATRYGRRGAMQGAVLSVMSLLALLALGRSLALEPLVRVAINVGVLLLTGAVAGWLGQRRIDAVHSAERRAEELAVLNEIGRTINARTEMDRLLELLKPIIPFDGYALYLYQAQPVERMRIVAALELAPEEREMAERTALERHPGWVVRNRQTLRVDDTCADDRVRYVRPHPPRSILYAPMRYEDRCLGAIGLGRFGPPPFSEADEHLLQAVADQAAVAVENAQLYQELEERAYQLHRTYEELQNLDRRRAEFVQDVSHDLRAPLTFIKGYAELMLQGKQGPLTEQQRKSLDIVLDKTKLLSRMAEDIILLQRPQLGLDTLTPTSLPDLARVALQGAEAAAMAAHITLRVETPDDIPQVPADPRRLMQVFDNLLSNAIKYSPGGGTVTVSVEDVDDTVQVAVKDEGIGIPKEAQAHVFERFYQVDPSRSRRFGSIGLGLAIVKEVVEDHGGKVWLESEVGRGSTFYFTVPKTPLAHPAR